MPSLHGPASFVRGDTFEIIGSLHKADGSPLALTEDAAIEWRLENAAGATILNYTRGNGIVVFDAANGKIKITLPAADTQNIPAGDYRDECRVTIAAFVSTQWTGTIKAKKSLFD